MTIGEKLQELMDWSGKSQGDLHRLTGIAQSTLSEYVRDLHEPPLSALRRLADALGVSLWTIIDSDPLAVKGTELTQQERQLVVGYRTLSAREQHWLQGTVTMLADHRRP